MSALDYAKLPFLRMGLMKLPDPVELQSASFLEKEAVPKEKYLNVCRLHRIFPVLYQAEFQTAGVHEEYSRDAGKNPENVKRNRNPKVLPYDYNRVILEPDDNYEHDYINASHVDSLMAPKEYIVTQGPLEETVEDFWRMVWQERVTCIIMLTKSFDFTKKMCTQYWPTHDSETYGPFKVQMESKKERANFQVNTLTIWRTDSQVEDVRKVLHFYYTEWPSYANAFIPALLEFRRRVHQTKINDAELANGKTLVHCNDGAGRSGVYISVDANIEFLDRRGFVDVFGYLKMIKKSRAALVETENQVEYIYKVLEEYMICKHKWFPVKDFLTQYQVKTETKGRRGELAQEYRLIGDLTPVYSVGDCAGSYREENRMKNRDITVITPDNFRPYLTTYQGTLETDFINACFIDTYKHSKGTIITEWPLPDTISFFWSLVYDYNVSTIIVLSAPDNEQQYPSFWPEEQESVTYGPVFTVNQLSHNHFDYVRSWMYEVNKKIISLTDLMTGVKAKPKLCQLFQITNWPMGDKVPTSPAALIDLMILVHRWNDRVGGGPILLMSHDGKSRVGIMAAAISCIQQIQQDGEVDVFTVARTLRRYRPRILPSLTEYRYCYDVVLHYVIHCLKSRQKQKIQEK